MSNTFHSLSLKKTVQETSDTISIYFDIPDSLKSNFSFVPGQYLTLKVKVNGEELRRPYSICSANFESDLAVTVKRVEGGRVSNWLNDKAASISSIEVMEPDGNFVIKLNPDLKRNHVFICAGSGITPVMSMIKSTLEDEPKSSCYLLYGNTNEDSIIFESELQKLSAKYEGQLFVKHTLSKPKTKKAGGLKGIFGKKKSNWSGWTGRINGSKLEEFLNEITARSPKDQYYLCGPGTMIDDMKSALKSREVNSDQIHNEYFTTADTGKEKANAGSQGDVEVVLNKQTVKVFVSKEKTILEALVDAGFDPPYSCTSGACSTCVAKVISGSVEMDACHALDDDEIKDGYILSCQAHPSSTNVKISYDD
jgi:ring-1,2-phenylacetyl-CoA epoxidase subunit PaaE